MGSRRTVRLQGYDYSQAGAYIVTMCTQHRECLFGEIAEGRMTLSQYGTAVRESWDDLPQHYPHVVLDAFVVMPNHVHGIIVLQDGTRQPFGTEAGFKPAPTDDSANRLESVGAGFKPARSGRVPKWHPLSEIVRAFKTFSARQINIIRATPGQPVWQRSYYEHVIRNEDELYSAREYIQNNPLRWHLDRENPDRKPVSVAAHVADPEFVSGAVRLSNHEQDRFQSSI